MISEPLQTPVNIEDKLFLNRFVVDTIPHLVIKDQNVCRECKDKPCLNFCPARVYEWKEDHITVGYEGCLECGACRIACPFNNIAWDFPRGGFGVQYRLA